jgi:hypothetical protein
VRVRLQRRQTAKQATEKRYVAARKDEALTVESGEGHIIFTFY